MGMARKLAATGLLLSAAGVSSVLAADQVVVNPGQSSSFGDVSGVRGRENPLSPPATSGTEAEPRSAILTSGVRGGALATDGGTARAFGSFGIPFTSTRVAAGATTTAAKNPNYLAATYPYRAVGKLVFSAGYCTASVILRSVIVTGAHCVQDFGSGSAMFTNFQFIPAHFAPGKTAAQRAPYGTWAWAALARPDSWANGTDAGSGAARDNDLAVIALAKNAAGKFIGDVTGKLGYSWNNYSFRSSSRTGNLAVAAVTTLGYPQLLDSGGRMQRTDGPAFLTTIKGAGQIWQGSNFTGGSSGGPWVVNFRAANPTYSGGAGAGSEANMAVIGVTSWGSSDPNAVKDNYSSQFRQNKRYPKANYGGYGAGNIGSLLNTLCKKTAGGGKTYEQLGFCD
ncbi:MAG: serine protease [Geminicoccaceae bacterium]